MSNYNYSDIKELFRSMDLYLTVDHTEAIDGVDRKVEEALIFRFEGYTDSGSEFVGYLRIYEAEIDDIYCWDIEIEDLVASLDSFVKTGIDDPRDRDEVAGVFAIIRHEIDFWKDMDCAAHMAA